MDDITTRTVIVAVNIFITMTIVSIIVIMFFQMQEIYGVVAKIDTSIYSTFDDIYSMYNGSTMSGLGLLNTVKKYEDKTDVTVTIIYPGSYSVQSYALINNIRESVYLKSLMEAGNGYKYEDKYSVTVNDFDQANIQIIFSEI